MQLPDINDLMQDLQLAKQIAIEDRNPNAIVMATISQAKLLGMDKGVSDDNDVQPINIIVRTVDACKPEQVC